MSSPFQVKVDRQQSSGMDGSSLGCWSLLVITVCQRVSTSLGGLGWFWQHPSYLQPSAGAQCPGLLGQCVPRGVVGPLPGSISLESSPGAVGCVWVSPWCQPTAVFYCWNLSWWGGAAVLQNVEQRFLSVGLRVRFNSAGRTIPETECSQCPNTFLIYISKYKLFSRDYAFV